jgi:protoporphyrinogen IX oxidase
MRVIMLPAMVVTWGTGLTLAIQGRFFAAGWLHAKLALVIGLTALHGYFTKVRMDFAKANILHSAKFYRLINEAPTVLLMGIVFLVVFKPF